MPRRPSVRAAELADVPGHPALLRHGVGFWPALLAGCALMIALYFGMRQLLARAGMKL